jgi:peptidoglycan/LPS O-acetylase OafA/YrhL
VAPTDLLEHPRVHEPTASITTEAPWRHVPALDGVRMLAVYLVVLFHGGLGVFEGGFIGVDLFFVLSGFLVTGVMLEQHASAGRISLRRFYARRFRRLLPAAAVTLVGTSFAFLLVSTPAERLDVLDGARASFLYVANWQFLGQASDYFGAEVAKSPFLHFWSLAIEEQFYLCFPLLLTGLLAVGKRRAAGRGSWLLGALLLLGGASLASQLYFASTEALRAYYATDARLYQLLAGAALVVYFRSNPAAMRRRAFSPRAGALAALAVLVAGTSVVDATPSIRGMLATVASVLLVGSIFAHQERGAARLFGQPLPVYLGGISYGTYLWHWPLVVFLDRTLNLSPIVLAVLAGVGGTALAALSARLLELPVRRSRILDRALVPTIAGGLAVSLVGGLVVAPAILRSDRPSALISAPAPVVDPGVADEPVPPDVPWEEAHDERPVAPNCTDADVERCVVARGAGPHIHLIGDSHAMTLLDLFTRMAEEHDFTFSATVVGSCPWQRGLGYTDSDVLADRCADQQVDWYERVLPELRPDVVVLFERGLDDPAYPRTMQALDPRFADLDQAELARRTSDETLDELSAAGYRTVILEPIPMATFDPTACLSGATTIGACAFRTDEQPNPSEVFFREALPTRPQLWSVDIDRLVCPDLPTCMPMVGGEITRRDRHHLTLGFAEALAPSLYERMKQAGVFDGL